MLNASLSAVWDEDFYVPFQLHSDTNVELERFADHLDQFVVFWIAITAVVGLADLLLMAGIVKLAKKG
jgi:hypothetical protein